VDKEEIADESTKKFKDVIVIIISNREKEEYVNNQFGNSFTSLEYHNDMGIEKIGQQLLSSSFDSETKREFKVCRKRTCKNYSKYMPSSISIFIFNKNKRII